MSIVAKVGVRLHTTVACTKLFSLTVNWSKLEKSDSQISIGPVVFFLFNGFVPKRLVHVFAKLMIFSTTFFWKKSLYVSFQPF